MTDSNRIPSELMELAKWVDDQLGATAISRQVIAEQAADRIRGLAEQLRGAAKPGDDPAAEELRLAEAEAVIMAALTADSGQMPPSVLLRAHQELLRKSRWLLGVVLGDPRLAESSQRVRAEGKRRPLEVAILHPARDRRAAPSRARRALHQRLYRPRRPRAVSRGRLGLSPRARSSTNANTCLSVDTEWVCALCSWLRLWTQPVARVGLGPVRLTGGKAPGAGPGGSNDRLETAGDDREAHGGGRNRGPRCRTDHRDPQPRALDPY